jgi:hypothetical protein
MTSNNGVFAHPLLLQIEFQTHELEELEEQRRFVT